MINIGKYFGNNLRTFRILRGYTQEKLAELLEIETSTLSKIECGKSYPHKSTIEKIVEVLDIQPYLLYITNNDDFDIEQAHNEMLELLKELKGDKELFKRVYDFAKELCNKK